jgi:hypothetical protein
MRTTGLSPGIVEEFGAVTVAENQVLVLLQDRVSGKSQRAPGGHSVGPGRIWDPGVFIPRARTLGVIARLVVHLTRVRVIKVRRVVPLAVDYLLGVAALTFVLFSTGWSASNNLGQLPRLIVMPGTVLIVVLAGRVAAVVVIRLPALRFRWLARRGDVRRAVEDVLDHELPQLIRWRQRAERLDQLRVADRLAAEIVVVDDLRRDVRVLTANDLDWAMRTNWSAAAVPKSRYRWDLWIAAMRYLAGMFLLVDTSIEYKWMATIERLLAIPLTRVGAMAAATDRLERILWMTFDRLDEPPLAKARDGSIGD